MMYRLVAVVGLGLLLVGGVAHALPPAQLSDFGAFDGSSYTFIPNGVTWGTNWSDTNNKHSMPPGLFSGGGEWFDIEGLYLKVLQPDASHTTLEWCVITSDPGLNPGMGPGYSGGEWNGDLGTAPTPGVGGYAPQRDGYNASSFVYHRNPVIGLDLNGNGSLEYGLVLDDVGSQAGTTLATGNGNVNAQATGIGALNGFSAGLYAVNNPLAWTDSWVGGADYPNFVDLVTDSAVVVNGHNNLTSLVKTSTDTQRIVSPVNESATPGYQPMAGDYQQNRDYIWLGSMDITALGDIKVGAQATYGMWCGNDWVVADSTEHFDNTPELSTWALLSCTSLLGLFGLGWRRRRSA